MEFSHLDDETGWRLSGLPKLLCLHGRPCQFSRRLQPVRSRTQRLTMMAKVPALWAAAYLKRAGRVTCALAPGPGSLMFFSAEQAGPTPRGGRVSAGPTTSP